MPLSTNISFQATGKQTAALDLGTGSVPFSLSQEMALTDGTTAGKADRVFADTRQLTASATENLDLAGALSDFYGATLTFVTVKAIIVRAAATNTNDVQVTRPAANGVPFLMAASDGIALKPGAVFAWFMSGVGVTVTPGTGDLITVTNSAGGTSVSYDVLIIGTSA